MMYPMFLYPKKNKKQTTEVHKTIQKSWSLQPRIDWANQHVNLSKPFSEVLTLS